MSPSEDQRTQLEARAKEIKFMGTQYALQGVSPPNELTEEYERIQAELRETAAQGS